MILSTTAVRIKVTLKTLHQKMVTLDARREAVAHLQNGFETRGERAAGVCSNRGWIVPRSAIAAGALMTPPYGRAYANWQASDVGSVAVVCSYRYAGRI